MTDNIERESMEFDVVIVGAGPSGLSTACRLMQLAKGADKELSVCVVEKGSEVGAHILSGAVFETRALDELFPDWKVQGAPLRTQVSKDDIYWLTDERSQLKIPSVAYPRTMHNDGNYIASIGNLCRWLAVMAEELGVEVFPGFPAADVIIENDIVKGIITADMGVAEDGTHKDSFEPGIEIRARQTVFAEGGRGHLGKKLIQYFRLDEGRSPQHYAIGFKEIWDVPEDIHEEGLVLHSAGWPLSVYGKESTGGGYLYHAENNQVYVGLIVDLNYTNPHLSPFDEFQKLKHHPVFSQYLKKGKRVSYGARAISKGGLNSLPKMTFPGGLLVGCEAGTLNFSKIKGNHTAMKSGMLAAEAIFSGWDDETKTEMSHFKKLFEDSWVHTELTKSRNFGAAIHKFGILLGGAYNCIEQNLLFGKSPLTLMDEQKDHKTLGDAFAFEKPQYDKPDGVLSFDKLSSVFLSNTNHAENQPCHLRLEDKSIPIVINLKKWEEPAQRYCPAGVYELIEDEKGNTELQINSQNCIHCKTCDIKDPTQNITWVTPEGSGGPNYPNM